MTVIRDLYLGLPGAMQKLPSPTGDVSAPATRGDTVHQLLSGGVAVTARLNAKRSWSIGYDSLIPDDADILNGFYQRVFGLGPFTLVDPSTRNVLGLDVSTVGVRSNASPGWVKSTGTLTTSTGGPVGATASGVLTWGTLAASATLQPGLVANTADLLTAPVYLPGEAATCSLYIKASSASTMSLQLTGYNAAGAVLVTSAATSVSATTSFQRFTVSIAANAAAFASAVFILPRLVLGGTVPTTVSIAGAQLEYADTVSNWQMGYGSPRVLITGSPGRGMPILGYSDHTFTLGEV